jgi:hypothetical protein
MVFLLDTVFMNVPIFWRFQFLARNAPLFFTLCGGGTVRNKKPPIDDRYPLDADRGAALSGYFAPCQDCRERVGAITPSKRLLFLQAARRT